MPKPARAYTVADEVLLEGLQAGDRVRVGVRESDEGLLIESIQLLPPDEHAGHGHDEVQP